MKTSNYYLGLVRFRKHHTPKAITMSMPQMDAAQQAKLQLMQEMEIEMMSDLYSRMTQACHKKCIPPKYSDAELGK